MTTFYEPTSKYVIIIQLVRLLLELRYCPNYYSGVTLAHQLSSQLETRLISHRQTVNRSTKLLVHSWPPGHRFVLRIVFANANMKFQTLDAK